MDDEREVDGVVYAQAPEVEERQCIGCVGHYDEQSDISYTESKELCDLLRFPSYCIEHGIWVIKEIS